MKGLLIEKTTTLASAYSVGGTAIDLGESGKVIDSLALTIQAAVTTPANKTFAAAAVNTTADTITITAHGFSTALKVQISNPGTLPTGISGATDYFVIVVDSNTIKLASSGALALAGTAIDITGQGAGTNTATVTALAGGTAKLQQSNLTTDASFVDLGSSQNITQAGYLFFEKDKPTSRYVRVYLTITAGQLTLTNYIVGKGEL